MKTDIDLIQEIKEEEEKADSLTALIQRHSGIYVDIVNRYIREDFGIVRKNDILQEKDFNIYRCALKFNPDKNTKFSTFLGNETKWMCLNLYNRNKKEKFNQEISDMLTPFDGHDLSFIKNRIDCEIKNEVNKIIEGMPDERIRKIFEMRYLVGQKNTVMPWKQICKEVDLSIQGCINVHDRGIKYIKEKLNKEFYDQ